MLKKTTWALCLALAGVPLARAEFVAAETEPNNSVATQNILPTGFGRVTGAVVAGDQDHFRFTLTPGARVAAVISSGTFDTILGSLSDTGAVLSTNDDSGVGLLSALPSFVVGASGRVNLGVTGFADFGFTGAHSQSGTYALDVVGLAGAGTAADTGANNTFATRQVLAGGTGTVTGTMSAGDVDFFTFTGLTPGSGFVAEITSGDFDTILGFFSETGALIDSNDDTVGLLSVQGGIVGADGTVTIAVTGFADFGFSGAHSQTGAYTLSFFGQPQAVPEPSIVVLLGLGTAGALGYHLRRRQGVA